MSKTILITGATDGIGLLTAQKLAADGHRVLLHGRNDAKLAQAQEAVGGMSETYKADLSKAADVVALAQSVQAKHDTLDALINNAGVLKTPQTFLPDGQDIRFVVNTHAPYLLAQLLLPIIPKEGRVVNLSSAAQAPIEQDALSGKRPLSDMEAYAQSKLAITIWTAALAKAMPQGPQMIAVNPGSLLASKMVKEGFGVAGKDLSIGADILIDAALGARFADVSGQYFDNDSGMFAPAHPAAQDAGQVAMVMKAVEDYAAPHL